MDKPFKIADDCEIVCYSWDCGAYLNGYSENFQRDMDLMVAQFGYPTRADRSALNGRQYDVEHHMWEEDEKYLEECRIERNLERTMR